MCILNVKTLEQRGVSLDLYLLWWETIDCTYDILGRLFLYAPTSTIRSKNVFHLSIPVLN